MELSSMEYKKIAQFYNIPKASDKTYKEIAEDVLAGKLCKCIKKSLAKPGLYYYISY